MSATTFRHDLIIEAEQAFGFVALSTRMDEPPGFTYTSSIWQYEQIPNLEPYPKAHELKQYNLKPQEPPMTASSSLTPHKTQKRDSVETPLQAIMAGNDPVIGISHQPGSSVSSNVYSVRYRANKTNKILPALPEPSAGLDKRSSCEVYNRNERAQKQTSRNRQSAGIRDRRLGIFIPTKFSLAVQWLFSVKASEEVSTCASALETFDVSSLTAVFEPEIGSDLCKRLQRFLLESRGRPTGSHASSRFPEDISENPNDCSISTLPISSDPQDSVLRLTTTEDESKFIATRKIFHPSSFRARTKKLENDKHLPDTEIDWLAVANEEAQATSRSGESRSVIQNNHGVDEDLWIAIAAETAWQEPSSILSSLPTRNVSRKIGHQEFV